MLQFKQTVIKEIKERAEIEIILENLRNPKLGGWKREEIDILEKKGTVTRTGTLSDGLKLTETLELGSTLEKLQIVRS